MSSPSRSSSSSSSARPPPPPPLSSKPPPSSSRRNRITANDLDETQAEKDHLQAMENYRRKHTQNHPASQQQERDEKKLGERVADMLMLQTDDDDGTTTTNDDKRATPVVSHSNKGAARLRDLARKVMLQKKAESMRHVRSYSQDNTNNNTRYKNQNIPFPTHRRRITTATAGIGGTITTGADCGLVRNRLAGAESTADNKNNNKNENRNNGAMFFENATIIREGQTNKRGESNFAIENTQVDRLVQGALQVEELLNSTTEDEDDASASTAESATDERSSLLPTASTADATADAPGDAHGTARPTGRRRRRGRHRRKKLRQQGRKLQRILAACPGRACQWLRNAYRSSRHTLGTALALFAGSAICFYQLGNPHFDFMPGPATLSWWMNFMGRQLLTLELARLSQFLLIDGLVLGSRFAVQSLGPIVTLWALQARGIPLVLLAWGVYDLLLLHGDNEFQTHWFYWTGWKIYSSANSGSYILSSALYLRALLCLVFVGLVTSVKRAAVAVYFGRKTFAEFKPRLEKILKDIVLLSEVADLAEEADLLSKQDGDLPLTPDDLVRERRGNSSKDIALHNVTGSMNWDEAAEVEEVLIASPERSKTEQTVDRDPLHRARSGSAVNLPRNMSGNFKIKNMLDRWEEPINKFDKTTDNASIQDILRFRRALAFMDETTPFGESFGPATTRDECIESANNVFQRLMRLSSAKDHDVLSNDVLEWLSQEPDEEDDGRVNVVKRNAMRKLFRPDRQNNIPLLAFIQSCDTLYRKLRYFRASVGNASVIDHVLEQMIDVLFWFCTFLIVLTSLNVNPWPLLVSMSTLFVSFSFAMGSSASNYIEGVLLIAVRRPYDLGDRIVFTASAAVDNPGAPSSWFVEDINLFSTTLRFVMTNEVATVNNGTIASARICNLSRSPNAVLNHDILLHISVLEKVNGSDQTKADIFKGAIEKYIDDNPRVWANLLTFRYTKFDHDMDQVFVRLVVRHRNSWQDAARIYRDFGELQKVVLTLGKDLGINYETPPARRLLYQGGSLKVGQVIDYKKNLLASNNIESFHPLSRDQNRNNSVDSILDSGSVHPEFDHDVGYASVPSAAALAERTADELT